MSAFDTLDLKRIGPAAQFLITAAVTLTFLGSIGTLFLFTWYGRDFQPGVKETLILLVGVLAGEFKNVCGFWLGTSIGSQKQTDASIEKGKDGA